MDLSQQSNSQRQNLMACRKAVIIYDLTRHFCERFIDNDDHTREYIVRSAYSAKKILEKHRYDCLSTELAAKHLHDALINFGELSESLERYLRSRNLLIWEVGSERIRSLRHIVLSHSDSASFVQLAEFHNDEWIVNIIVVLIRHEEALLNKIIAENIRQHQTKTL